MLTNGANWRFYFTYGAGTYAERLVVALDLKADPVDMCVATLDRYLSYRNTESGKAADHAREDLAKQIDRRKARNMLPSAWAKLVESTHDNRLASLLSETTATLAGSSPEMADVVSFLRGLKPAAPSSRGVESRKPSPARQAGRGTDVPRPETAADGTTSPVQTPQTASRNTRKVRYTLLGEEQVAKNAKDAFIAVFTALAERDPNFLEQCDPKLRGRKNRVLAQERRELSDNATSLKSAVQLPGDWWLRTHMSNNRKIARLKTACEVAQIPFGDPSGLDIKLQNA